MDFAFILLLFFEGLMKVFFNLLRMSFLPQKHLYLVSFSQLTKLIIYAKKGKPVNP